MCRRSAGHGARSGVQVTASPRSSGTTTLGPVTLTWGGATPILASCPRLHALSLSCVPRECLGRSP